jgi:hypothetical protein
MAIDVTIEPRRPEVQWLPLVVQPPLDCSTALHRAGRVPDVSDVPLGDLVAISPCVIPAGTLNSGSHTRLRASGHILPQVATVTTGAKFGSAV